jgi:hypothetical protein
MPESKITALKIEDVPLDLLTPDPRNARLHPPENKAAVMESIRRFGMRSALVVRREGMIVLAGNLRLECLRELGFEKAPCLIVDDDESAAAAFALADNRTAEMAEWDNEVLAAILSNIQNEDARALGWTDHDLEGLHDLICQSVEGSSNPLDEWKDMPEFDEKMIKTVHVHFKTESDFEEFTKLIEDRAGPIDKARSSVWFPKKLNKYQRYGVEFVPTENGTS